MKVTWLLYHIIFVFTNCRRNLYSSYSRRPCRSVNQSSFSLNKSEIIPELQVMCFSFLDWFNDDEVNIRTKSLGAGILASSSERSKGLPNTGGPSGSKIQSIIDPSLIHVVCVFVNYSPIPYPDSKRQKWDNPGVAMTFF